MIVVIGRVRTDAEKRAELVRLGTAVASRSRDEAGCLDYRFLADTEDGDAYMFVEQWADEAALREHFAQPHLRSFMRDLQAVTVGESDVAFHTVESSRGFAEMLGR